MNKKKLAEMLEGAIENLKSDEPGEDEQGYNLIEAAIAYLKKDGN